jgi:hypothetical protein
MVVLEYLSSSFIIIGCDGECLFDFANHFMANGKITDLPIDEPVFG